MVGVELPNGRNRREVTRLFVGVWTAVLGKFGVSCEEKEKRLLRERMDGNGTDVPGELGGLRGETGRAGSESDGSG